MSPLPRPQRALPLRTRTEEVIDMPKKKSTLDLFPLSPHLFAVANVHLRFFVNPSPKHTLNVACIRIPTYPRPHAHPERRPT